MINVQIIDNKNQIKPKLSDSMGNISIYDNDLQAISAIENNKPSVILLNYEFRQKETFNFIKSILKSSANSNIILIADKLNEEEIINCLKAGAKGYQELNELSQKASRLIHATASGESWTTRHLATVLIKNLLNTRHFLSVLKKCSETNKSIN